MDSQENTPARLIASPYVNEISFSSANDPKVAVPEQQHIPFIYYLMMLIGATFLTLGISSLASVSGYISSAITTFFYNLTGWNQIVTGIIIGCVCLLLSVIFYVNGAKSKQIAQKIHEVMNVVDGDIKPKRFYDMDIVPLKYKIQALERIGCKVYQDRDLKGITIHCDNIDESQVFTNVNYDLNISRKIIQFLVLVSIPLFMTFTAFEGWWLYSEWEAVVWFCSIVIVLLILIELYTIPIWVSVVMGWIYLLIGYLALVGSMTVVMWWNFAGIWIAYTCVIASLYYIKGDFCKPNSIFCTRM